jgi:hypothetical protein
VTRALGLVLAATLLSGAASDVANQALQDQFGRTDSLAAHDGQVVLVMVVTAKRLRNLKAWERDLRERVADLEVIRIADVPRSDPPVTREHVVDKLVRRVPDEVSVLIDLEGRWAQAFELDTARPNLLLFDRDGGLAGQYRGLHQATTAEQVARRISELRSRN